MYAPSFGSLKSQSPAPQRDSFRRFAAVKTRNRVVGFYTLAGAECIAPKGAIHAAQAEPPCSRRLHRWSLIHLKSADFR